MYKYTLLLIWSGHAPFCENANKKRLVDYLELRILPKVVRRNQNEFWFTQQNVTVQMCIGQIPQNGLTSSPVRNSGGHIIA